MATSKKASRKTGANLPHSASLAAKSRARIEPKTYRTAARTGMISEKIRRRVDAALLIIDSDSLNEAERRVTIQEILRSQGQAETLKLERISDDQESFGFHVVFNATDEWDHVDVVAPEIPGVFKIKRSGSIEVAVKTLKDALSALIEEAPIATLKSVSPDTEDRREPFSIEELRARALDGGESLLERIESAGGFLSGSEAAARAKVSRNTINNWRHDRLIVGLPVGRRNYKYPAFQFVKKSGNPLPGLKELIGTLEAKGLDDFEIAEFLLTEDEKENAEFARPLDLLKAGKAASALKMAGRHGEQGA